MVTLLFIVIVIMSGIIGYFRIRSLNAETELTDLQIKCHFAQKTLDAIIEKEEN